MALEGHRFFRAARWLLLELELIAGAPLDDLRKRLREKHISVAKLAGLAKAASHMQQNMHTADIVEELVGGVSK